MFHLEEATVADINAAFDAGALTSERLVQMYLSRIEAYDNNGPNINSIITVNPMRQPEYRKIPRPVFP